jgi:hypothetical protein
MVINCAVIAIQIHELDEFDMAISQGGKILVYMMKLTFTIGLTNCLKIKMSTPKILFCIQVQSVKENSPQLK